jgi:hypothetical protein
VVAGRALKAHDQRLQHLGDDYVRRDVADIQLGFSNPICSAGLDAVDEAYRRDVLRPPPVSTFYRLSPAYVPLTVPVLRELRDILLANLAWYLTAARRIILFQMGAMPTTPLDGTRSPRLLWIGRSAAGRAIGPFTLAGD